MKNIAIFTTSRAEFGLLSALIQKIRLDPDLDFELFAGGGHCLDSQGHSIDEIKSLNIRSITFDFLSAIDDNISLAKSMGKEIYLLADLFENYQFDFVCVLGDRIEILPIVQVAIIYRKPIIHLYGGEITEGAIDEQIRHMITKASHVHFTACDEYRRNVIRMGEESWRVHNVGSLGIDVIINNDPMSKQEIYGQYHLDISKQTVLLTYHPATLEFGLSEGKKIMNIFQAMKPYEFQVLITAPNIDLDHSEIMQVFEREAESNKFYIIEKNLGIKNYHSMLNYVEFVIGNSSSGIVEVPFYKIPTVNIGERQKGRIRHRSVIDTGYRVEDIRSGIEQAIESEFRKSLGNMEYKFGDGHAADNIVETIKSMPNDVALLGKKLEFSYD